MGPNPGFSESSRHHVSSVIPCCLTKSNLKWFRADFLYGPLWAASLVTAVYALREHIGELAPRRMTLALLAAFVAAAMFVTVASIRYSNRHYQMSHPELNLEMSTPVLVVWTTITAGVSAAGWHFLGWRSC